MAYSRQPQVVITNGGALKQTPLPTTTQPPGVVPVELEARIATTSSLGVVEIGSGLSITSSGVLSAINGGNNNFVAVTLTAVDYTVTATDSYVGATKKDLEITLPLGILGRVYYIKNQSNGNIKVEGSGSETIDGISSKTLGSNSGFMLVFDGSRWNIL